MNFGFLALFLALTINNVFASIDASTANEDCYQSGCVVFINVDKVRQEATIYIDGIPTYQWPVSTGGKGFLTPNFDRHPSGPVYQKKSSSLFPGGDYKGLGNMPYAITIRGAFAVHGTVKSNWRLLGQTASHGCVRLHPENAKILNKLVLKYGLKNTWITVR